jgi:hypothetical protein
MPHQECYCSPNEPQSDESKYSKSNSFFCLTSEKEITKIASAIKNRFRPPGSLRANDTAKQKRALNPATVPNILSRTESICSSLIENQTNKFISAMRTLVGRVFPQHFLG